jgi:serine kinase of HPr protein (carbohydrate metabolism regulator)
MASGDPIGPVLHATAVAIDGAALLLVGPSGSGKSDLAFRLIDAGAALIADDRVELVDIGNVLCCRAPADVPAGLRGRIELRGVGIVPVRTAVRAIPVQWLVKLVAPDAVERLPEPELHMLMGHAVPVLRISAFESSAPAKLRLAVAQGPGLIMTRS